MNKSRLLGAVCAYLSFSLPAFGQDFYWICDDDVWDEYACWSHALGGVPPVDLPVAGDNVFFMQSDGTDRTISYQNSYAPIDTFNSLLIDATGTGSVTLLHNQDDLNVLSEIIGKSGTGTLNLSGGTHDVTNNIQLGDTSTGDGTVLVSDTGQLTVGNILVVGTAGAGALNISGGGSVSSTFTRMGSQSGSYGSATIDGAGSTLSGSQIAVGHSGTGTLDITNGGVATLSNTATIGSLSTGDGTATIDGTGSSLTSVQLTVGSQGTGTLNITNGGSVSTTTSGAFVGNQAGSTGSVTVDGLGSTFDTNVLEIGANGDGTFNIVNEGSVTNSLGYIGRHAGSSGEVTVSGAGSSWINNSNLYIGDRGTGILNIDSGGMVSTDAASFLGVNVGSNGTATVSGVGTTWSSNGSLVVGHNTTGMLNIDSGGMVTNTNGFLGNSFGSSGTATVSGLGSTWTNSTEVIIGNSGTGAMNIDNGGLVTNTLGFIGNNNGSSGTATVSGAGSTWTNSSNLYVGVSGSGILNIETGGSVSSTVGFLGRTVSASGTATVTGSGSIWSISSHLYVGGSSTAAYGNGTLNVQNNGLVSVGGHMKVWETGTVNLNGGDLTVSGTYTTSGDTIIKGGNLTASTVEVLGGKLKGKGKIKGNVNNKGGKVNPGNSPGTLTIDGNYTQEVGGELIIEIAGLNPGEFDVLEVLGTATFDPGTTITLDFIGGFAPSIGEQFDFLLADTIFGDMGLVDYIVLGLEPGFDFNAGPTGTCTFCITALNNGVSSVPIPGAVWLFSSGLVGLLGMAKRKKVA